MRSGILTVALVLVVAACGDSAADPTVPSTTTTAPSVGPGTTMGTPPDTTPPAPVDTPLLGLDAQTVARTLDNPVFLTAVPGDDRLFVLEKDGVVRIIDNDGLRDEAFLDIEELVEADSLEQGLLGMAFHPDYPNDGRFFVYYTGETGQSVLAEYRVSSDPDRADQESGRVLLTQHQPETNHNAGMLEFGPDGYLWVALGDGGGAGDPGGNARDTGTLLGSILRLDVDAGEPYRIPPDNPFVDGGGEPQIWLYGVRNPWRFSIDHVEGLVYVADVGQDEWEEISVLPADAPGLDLGWPIMEGVECYKADSCDSSGMTPPVFTYSHAEGCSITGGFVYRGSAIPELWGHYFYGDWCGRWVRSFRHEDGEITDERDWTADLGQMGQVQSFGRGGHGELYVLTADGFVIRIVPRR